MFQSLAQAALVLATMTLAQDSPQQRRTPECTALLKAGLGDRVLFPGDEAYEPRVTSYWSKSNQLRPYCIVQPRDTEEVSETVKALADVDGANIALRSGGHMQWRGASSIANGVTIDLGLLNETWYNPRTKLASIEPSPRWGDVFEILEQDGVSVAGGRDGNVGIGGYVTGGGNSYYAGRRGFACDTIVNAEVVLGDGRIVNANEKENKDLWKALKGGSGNFGIVTRFDLQTFEAKELWKAVRVSAANETDAVVDALVDFTDTNDQFPEAALIVQWTHDHRMSPDITIAQAFVDTDTVEFPKSYDRLREVPATRESISIQPQSEIAKGNVLPGGFYNSWHTLTVKNDGRIVKKSVELHKKVVEELLEIAAPEDFTTKILWQPIPKAFAEIGEQNGGNVLGLEDNEDNALMLLVYIQTNSPELEAIGHRKAQDLGHEVKKYAQDLNAVVPWLYLNYADSSQDPVKSYGKKNRQFLEKVSKKYDKKGFFQKKVTSGFKLGI